MNDVMNQTEAANRMMDEIEANQTAKAAMRAQRAEDVREAMEDAKAVATRVAAGNVTSPMVGEPVESDPSLSPATEAVEGARVIDAYLARKAARKARHEATVINYEKAVLAQAHAARNMAGALQ